MHRAHGVTRVAYLIVAHVDLRRTAMPVALQLALTPMSALCSVSNSDVISCSDVTSVTVHPKTPLHRRVQALVFWSVVSCIRTLSTAKRSAVVPHIWTVLHSFCKFIWRSISHHLKRYTTSSAALPVPPTLRSTRLPLASWAIGVTEDPGAWSVSIVVRWCTSWSFCCQSIINRCRPICVSS